MTRLDQMRAGLARKAANIDSLRLRIDGLLDRAEELRSEAEAIPERLEALQHFNQFLQRRTFGYFEAVCDRCMESIFPNPFKLKIVPEVKRKQFEVRFEFHRDGMVLDPLTEVEYGVLDVASFALRIAYISLKPVRRLLIMDEPFKWVGTSNRVRIPALLEALSKDMGFQIVLVTHLPELIDEHAITLE